MADLAVRFEGVSKRYRRTAERANFRAALPGALGRREPPDSHLALDDVSFELEQGGALGVVGPNGAGKSTLLKILARVTAPSAGEVCTRGTVASLIELGVGFHPDLTGAENVRYAGALAGMSPRDVARRFDEIVAFAGVEKYLGMPAKRYSDGMLARLGFAVASHADAEIIVIDEVLAVGDAAFQRKGYERIRELHREGASCIFVGHDLWVISQICEEAVYLDRGRLLRRGPVEEVIEAYAGGGAASGQVWGDAGVVIERLTAPAAIEPGEPVDIEATVVVREPRPGATLQWTLFADHLGVEDSARAVDGAAALLRTVGRHHLRGRIGPIPSQAGSLRPTLVVLDRPGGDVLSRASATVSIRSAKDVASTLLHVDAQWEISSG